MSGFQSKPLTVLMRAPPPQHYTTVVPHAPPPSTSSSADDTAAILLFLCVALPCAMLLGCAGYLWAARAGTAAGRRKATEVLTAANIPLATTTPLRVLTDGNGDGGRESPIAASPKEPLSLGHIELQPMQAPPQPSSTPLLLPEAATAALGNSPRVNPLLGARAAGELGLGGGGRESSRGRTENSNFAVGEAPWSPSAGESLNPRVLSYSHHSLWPGHRSAADPQRMGVLRVRGRARSSECRAVWARREWVLCVDVLAEARSN